MQQTNLIKDYFLCPFCGCKKTQLSIKREDSIYKTFCCKTCYSRMFLTIDVENDLLKTFPKKLESIVPQFQTILKNCQKSIYKGNLICPICLGKIERFAPCKVKKKNRKLPQLFHWNCNNCDARGFINSKTIPKWKLSSSLLRFKL